MTSYCISIGQRISPVAKLLLSFATPPRWRWWPESGGKFKNKPLWEEPMDRKPGIARGAAMRPLVHAITALSTCTCVAMTVLPTAHAQPNYPTKPVRIFVPYGPGGVGDLTMRLVADKMSQNLKQQFIIENQPGAGGIVNATSVMRAEPDGYTLIEIGNGASISMSLFNDLPYNVLTDFAPISVTGSFEMLLAVPDSSPYKTIKDVVDTAQKNPGKINLGAINPGSTQNLSAHLFEQVTGAKFTIVTYRTTPDLVTALLRGDVDVGFDYFAGLDSEIGPGKVRIIATSSEERDPLLKDVPTAKESGYPAYIVTSWNGLAAPAKVSPEIINILHDAATKALADPDVKTKALNLGIDSTGSTPRQMHERLASDFAKWRDVIAKAGIPKQ
jgi:tripartite-type tricarboxylate transporter receptor subunit TctC